MPSLGPLELIIILVLAVMIFGVGRLPEVGGAIGKTIREFRNNMNSGRKSSDELDEEEEEGEEAQKPMAEKEAV